MIERADQLILNYVSAAADAAHGVLRSDQRLDFAKRLRARIEVERQGSQNPRQVVKVLARFGDPVALVEREARRLAEAGPGGAPGAPSGTRPGTAPTAAPGAARGTVTPGAVAKAERVAGAGGATPFFPKIVDDVAPPGAQLGRRLAEDHLAPRPLRGMPFARLRQVAMSGGNPMTTRGRDAGTIVKEYPRETAAMVVLVLAALLVPFGLPAVAIFRVPVLVWGLGALLVAFSEGWVLRDRLIGIGAPLVGYTLGGALVGGLRVGAEPGVQAFVVQFFDVSGVMFMIGTALGVGWLAYRLVEVN
ncbi:hypothetical protein [Nonomuraea aurantiaca]|uniref:hypothetical protein n=1 Tax=Nonomuraea aurantiaca TaxID=2878562 RepID=UPI001CD9F782|nr:hypothetical protein [Nonomuraea aurantiaca]MCA2228051.1 hypothetical protein [Nonomuraea aurantiaca]